MTIDDIFAQWDIDSNINRAELGKEATNIPKLHNKYYRYFINEKLILHKKTSEFKQVSALRYDLYAGTLDDDTIKQLGWVEDWEKYGRIRILKTEIQRYIEADRVLIDLQLKIQLQKEKVELLDSIIKSFVNRGFQIKNDIEFTKFQMGA